MDADFLLLISAVDILCYDTGAVMASSEVLLGKNAAPAEQKFLPALPKSSRRER